MAASDKIGTPSTQVKLCFQFLSFTWISRLSYVERHLLSFHAFLNYSGMLFSIIFLISISITFTKNHCLYQSGTSISRSQFNSWKLFSAFISSLKIYSIPYSN